MAELLIVCGLMGCGKTTLAKRMAAALGHEYISFDREFYGKIQERRNSAIPSYDVPEFIGVLARRLNASPDRDFVVDGWFMWHKHWWRDNGDKTIQRLRKLIRHEIRAIYLFVPFEETKCRYAKKHKDAGTPKAMLDAEFFHTMARRQDNMFSKLCRAFR